MNEPLLLNKHRKNSRTLEVLSIKEASDVYGGHCPEGGGGNSRGGDTCGTGHVTPNGDGCQHGGDPD